MKRFLLPLLALITLASSCSHNEGNRMKTTELTNWQFEYEGQRYPATVPGCIHTDLMANGLIPDPFYGTNEDSVQWVSDRKWDYYIPITRDMWEGYEHCELVLDGITLCDVWLEGRSETGATIQRRVLEGENMFREYRVDLLQEMRANTLQAIRKNKDYNQLEDSIILHITFYPIAINNENHFATREGADGCPQPDLPYDLPDHRVMTRMAPYMLGWDWGPRLSTVGITGSARLECHDGKRAPEKANVLKSWNVTLEQKDDATGRSFTFLRDGKPIFVKGANWIPCHSFPILTPQMKARYRYLLQSAKDANFNMLRIWGGGIYEPDYFYDLCDSLGLMVWQDFNFSCAPYPADSASLANIWEEACHQIVRIAKHPSVVLWCGNNEVKNGWEDWGWQQQYQWTPGQQREIEHAIDTIFGYSPDDNTSNTSLLARAVKECDPLQRPYITTSPLYGWGHPECVTHGDSHYWGVWWGEQPFEMYAEKTGRFMSEYGFQSYPLISSLVQFTPAKDLDIDSPTLRSHQKHPRGRQIIDKAMKQYYGVDSHSLSLEDYCYVSQLLQAWGTGYGIYQHLVHQYHCSGTLYWQLNDCWPVASWSSIDYYGNWKALHYRAQALFADNADLKQWADYYSVYPKDRTYTTPHFKLHSKVKKGVLTVTVDTQSDLYDLYLETVPAVNGHFTRNFVDLKAGESMTTTFVPFDPQAKMEGVRIVAKTLNEVMVKKQ